VYERQSTSIVDDRPSIGPVGPGTRWPSARRTGGTVVDPRRGHGGGSTAILFGS